MLEKCTSVLLQMVREINTQQGMTKVQVKTLNDQLADRSKARPTRPSSTFSATFTTNLKMRPGSLPERYLRTAGESDRPVAVMLQHDFSDYPEEHLEAL